MPSMRKLCAPLVIVTCLALAPAAAADGPVAQASKRCSVNQSPGAYGPTYTTGLRVRGVRCKDGRGYIGKWDRCRRRNGGRDGRCKRPGNGFRCREHRSNVISTQYDGVVGCRRGSDLIRFSYTQFT